MKFAVMIFGVIAYLLARLFAMLRTILPHSVSNIIARAEVYFYIYAHIAGGGIDDAVSSDIIKEPDILIPQLLLALMRLPINSVRQFNALLLLSFYAKKNSTIIDTLKNYAKEKNNNRFNETLKRVLNINV